MLNPCSVPAAGSGGLGRPRRDRLRCRDCRQLSRASVAYVNICPVCGFSTIYYFWFLRYVIAYSCRLISAILTEFILCVAIAKRIADGLAEFYPYMWHGGREACFIGCGCRDYQVERAIILRESDNATPHLSTIYDDQISGTIPYYSCFHDEIINIVKTIKPDPELWLDTGCGTGTLVSKCMNLFPNTVFLLADPSGDMMNEAKKKIGGHAGGRIKYSEPVTTQEISLKPRLHFDVVTAIQSHHYLSAEERMAATRVCYGALNKGGIFVTFENIRPFTVTGIEAGKQNWSNYQLSKGKSREQVKKHLERFDVEYFPITINEHMDLYRSCGFEVVEMLWLSYMQAGFYCIK